MRLHAVYALTEEGYGATGGFVEAADEVEKGGLARAVGPYEACDGAGLDVQGAVVNCADAAEVLDEIADFEDGGGSIGLRVESHLFTTMGRSTCVCSWG